MPLFLNLIYLSPLILYTTTYISVKVGKPPIISDNREKCLYKACGRHGNDVIVMRTVSSPCVLPLAS